MDEQHRVQLKWHEVSFDQEVRGTKLPTHVLMDFGKEKQNNLRAHRVRLNTYQCQIGKDKSRDIT